jgi:hypothetical protein
LLTPIISMLRRAGIITVDYLYFMCKLCTQGKSNWLPADKNVCEDSTKESSWNRLCETTAVHGGTTIETQRFRWLTFVNKECYILLKFSLNKYSVVWDISLSTRWVCNLPIWLICSLTKQIWFFFLSLGVPLIKRTSLSQTWLLFEV